MPKIWERMLQAPDEELLELISRRVYEKVSIRPASEQIVAVLRHLPVPQAGPAPSEKPDELAGEGGATKRLPPVSTTKPVEIVLWGHRHPVARHADVLRTVAEKLYERHADEFHKLLELRGQKYPFVARDLQALPGRSYEVASSGYFVGMNLSAANIRKRAERFLVCFGYPPSDIEVIIAT